MDTLTLAVHTGLIVTLVIGLAVSLSFVTIIIQEHYCTVKREKVKNFPFIFEAKTKKNQK